MDFIPLTGNQVFDGPLALFPILGAEFDAIPEPPLMVFFKLGRPLRIVMADRLVGSVYADTHTEDVMRTAVVRNDFIM